jgi:hypothetical protein
VQRNSRLVANAQDPRLPLLLWVDDNPHYNREYMRYAEELGIHVVAVTSTVSAKEWFESNSGEFQSLSTFVHFNLCTLFQQNSSEDMTSQVEYALSPIMPE